MQAKVLGLGILLSSDQGSWHFTVQPSRAFFLSSMHLIHYIVWHQIRLSVYSHRCHYLGWLQWSLGLPCYSVARLFLQECSWNLFHFWHLFPCLQLRLHVHQKLSFAETFQLAPLTSDLLLQFLSLLLPNMRNYTLFTSFCPQFFLFLTFFSAHVLKCVPFLANSLNSCHFPFPLNPP